MKKIIELEQVEKVLYLYKTLELLNSWIKDSSCYDDDFFICNELEMIYQTDSGNRIQHSDTAILFPELFQFENINYMYIAWGKFDVHTGKELNEVSARNLNRVEILKLTIDKINSKH